MVKNLIKKFKYFRFDSTEFWWILGEFRGPQVEALLRVRQGWIDWIWNLVMYRENPEHSSLIMIINTHYNHDQNKKFSATILILGFTETQSP